MKDFLKSELKTLKAKTGLNQYETFSAMPDAVKQIGILLDSMVIVCNMFPMIPDDMKKAIILEQMLCDEAFIGFNSKILYKWFNAKKNVYLSIEERTKDFGPIVFEPLSDETKKMIAEFQAGLLEKSEPKFPALDLTMEQIKYEDSLRLSGEEVKLKGTPSGMTAYTVDVKDEEGNLLMTVENVLAPNEDRAIILANEYALKQLK